MIGRVRDRATFESFRGRGRRVRYGPLTVVFVPATEPIAEASEPPRLAFAVSRKVGSAVVRNRLRRRLREIMRAMSQEQGALSPGAYLIIVHPQATDLSFDDLRRTVRAASAEVAS